MSAVVLQVLITQVCGMAALPRVRFVSVKLMKSTFSVAIDTVLHPRELSLANDFLQRTLMFQDIFLFETRPGDEKDDKNSLQRFGVLHLQREILEGSVADFNCFTSL